MRSLILDAIDHESVQPRDRFSDMAACLRGLGAAIVPTSVDGWNG